MKPIKRAIALCWIMLVACFIIKLFGGNWFEVVCTNEHFIIVCDFIDNNKVAYYLVGVLMYVASTSWIIMACSKITEPNGKELFIMVASLSVVWSTQFLSQTLRGLFDAIVLIVLPICLNVFKNKSFVTSLKSSWYRGFIGCAFTLIFQMMSLITRNIGIKITDDSTLLTTILMIDYYIMIVLYYLYVKKSKEDKSNG